MWIQVAVPDAQERPCVAASGEKRKRLKLCTRFGVQRTRTVKPLALAKPVFQFPSTTRDIRPASIHASKGRKCRGASYVVVVLRWGRSKEGELERLAKNLKAHVGARAPELRLR